MINIDHLQPRQLEIMAYIQKAGPVGACEVAAHFGIHEHTAAVHMHRLRKSYLLVPEPNKPKSQRMVKWIVRPGVQIKQHGVQVPHPKPEFERLIEQVSSIWHLAKRCEAYA